MEFEFEDQAVEFAEKNLGPGSWTVTEQPNGKFFLKF